MRDRILQAAVRALDEGGEGNIRVVAVAEAAGVTQGMISYYFKSRSNLVAEAQAVRFMSTLREDASALGEALESSATGREFRDAIVPIVRFLLSDERRAARSARVAAFGSATSRPELMETVAAAQGHLVGLVEQVVVRAQGKGLMVKDLDSRSIASLIMGLALGLFVSDIDPDRPSDEGLHPALMKMFESIIVLDVE